MQLSEFKRGDSYVPKPLRQSEPPPVKPRAEAFGIGVLLDPPGMISEPASVGMTAGPYPLLETALEYVVTPTCEGTYVIVHFKPDYSEEIAFKWNGGAWVRL